MAKDLNPDAPIREHSQSNAGAMRLYERHAFVAVATTEGDHEEAAPDVRYHWPNP